ncbi:hypothetical protein ILFOPFJJ_07041 [Ensifer psoraleae]|uniref:hypothetical protein n=1 Tax=Sinorhizobium psoraleae TaxID=520838 RepID=UPI0024AC4E3E|nr:hypothetical protein [Sinorhizobium psoraleae]
MDRSSGVEIAITADLRLVDLSGMPSGRVCGPNRSGTAPESDQWSVAFTSTRPNLMASSFPLASTARPISQSAIGPWDMATLGLSYAMEGAAQLMSGTQVQHALDLGIGDTRFEVGGILISSFDLLAPGIARGDCGGLERILLPGSGWRFAPSPATSTCRRAAARSQGCCGTPA